MLIGRQASLLLLCQQIAHEIALLSNRFVPAGLAEAIVHRHGRLRGAVKWWHSLTPGRERKLANNCLLAKGLGQVVVDLLTWKLEALNFIY